MKSEPEIYNIVLPAIKAAARRYGVPAKDVHRCVSKANPDTRKARIEAILECAEKGLEDWEIGRAFGLASSTVQDFRCRALRYLEK